MNTTTTRPPTLGGPVRPDHPDHDPDPAAAAALPAYPASTLSLWAVSGRRTTRVGLYHPDEYAEAVRAADRLAARGRGGRVWDADGREWYRAPPRARAAA